jgi:hypothetical protein
MKRVPHQMPASAGRVAGRRGEASSKAASDETRSTRQEPEGAARGLLAQALARENMQRARKRVKANRGAAGVDGLDIIQTKEQLKHAWPDIRRRLMGGTYKPQAVRRVGIQKPDGSERELGIPTVTDRLIQQVLLQVLQPLIDPTFSEHSYGFRPGRRARDAVDLSKFFDRVDHDILIDRLGKRVSDTGVIRLVRPNVRRTLDTWMRHQIGTIQLKHWKRGTMIYRELLALGAPVVEAHRIAANSRRWQRNSRYLLNSIFTIAYFDRLGMPRLS